MVLAQNSVVKSFGKYIHSLHVIPATFCHVLRDIILPRDVILHFYITPCYAQAHDIVVASGLLN